MPIKLSVTNHGSTDIINGLEGDEAEEVNHTLPVDMKRVHDLQEHCISRPARAADCLIRSIISITAL